ncbi:class I adenylate-forming enzyme family protein [Dactylosporangium sp. AC04546]|uniref:class I adenylate-forming enzyme family protein n=1 Tax=Dactylosporangium sp. AC04546 TaxID=2862460 RepID=UPI001EDFFC70|nr:class I adenylate-forming enzyme family protein [Dactylosporangium sp. AC04546]WVK88770.1 class I adenylate-forming enzyme family protein [Dactylosporangium sp. AC04546]
MNAPAAVRAQPVPSPQEIDDFLMRCAIASAEPAQGEPLAATVDRLRRLGLPPGSVVLLALPNGLQLVRLFFAAGLAGLVPVLLAPSTPAPRIRELARRLGAAAVAGLPGRVRAAAGADLSTVDLGGAALARLGGHELIRHGPGQVILLTSGTSGASTGCLHDLSALLLNARRHADAIGLTADDTVLVTLPVYYSFALVAQVLACLVTGAALVLSGPPFTVPEYRGHLVRRRVTVSSLTPLLADQLLAAGGTLPGQLRVLTVGGQALPPDRTGRLLTANPGLELYLTYGLTEAGPRVSTLAAHREPAHRHASAGRPLDGVEITLRDAGRGPEEQEVLVTSATVCRRRVGVPPLGTRPRAGLVAPLTVATGDLGHVRDGYLYLRGRISDFAVVRGEKVSLASVRELAVSLPGVLSAAARVEDDTVAVDLFVDEHGPAEPELRRTLMALLAPHERPGRLRLHRTERGGVHK